MTEVLAVIPARGGSKGLPRKNVLPLAGRPLIAHSIAAALGCEAIGRCIVSTEDAEIAAAATAHGAEVMERPLDLAGDTVRTNEVVAHVLETVIAAGDRPQVVVLLQPTSPLRTAAHVQACLDVFLPAWRAGTAASILSVCEPEHHPFKDLLVGPEGLLRPLIDEPSLETPRQLLPRAYRQNGAIYAVGCDAFLAARRFYLPPALPFVMDGVDSVDVDTAADLRLAEGILEQRRA